MATIARTAIMAEIAAGNSVVNLVPSDPNQASLGCRAAERIAAIKARCGAAVTGRFAAHHYSLEAPSLYKAY